LKLTPEDRERVRNVFVMALDEMDDSFSLEDMFAPFGELVATVLRDSRITAHLEEIAEP
jgi:hypothetical protein